MAELMAASTLDGLKYIAELDDEAVCDTMVSTVFEVLLRKAEAGQPAVDAASPAIGAAAAKQLYASLCALFLEASKADESAENVATILEENGVATARAAKISASFNVNKEQIRWTLRCTGISRANVVGCSWRLDYHVRSSATGVEHVPVYFVSLKTKEKRFVGVR
mmetsp:Transcript_49934/g.141135  ORF Transcript_49934/g.141135 Transcript_49934/m.141135 type:complete len:165 (+) Transcript_49934:134-628(+)